MFAKQKLQEYYLWKTCELLGKVLKIQIQIDFWMWNFGLRKEKV